MAITLSGTTGITTPADTITGNATVGGTLTVNGVSNALGVPGTAGNVMASNGTAWVSSAATGVVTGQTIQYGSATAPTGYLKCDGSTYNISAYPTLAGVLGSLPATQAQYNASFPYNPFYSGVSYTNSLTIVAYQGAIQYSSNGGVSWTKTTISGAQPTSRIVWTGTNYVGVTLGGGGQLVYTSALTNTSWTIGKSALSDQYSVNIMLYTGTRVITNINYQPGCVSPTFYPYYSTTNGASWVLGTTIGNFVVYSAAYGASIIVSVGYNYSTGALLIYTSPDGGVYTSRTVPAGMTGSYIASCSFVNSLFVAVDNVGNVCSSADGITWTYKGNAGGYGDVVYLSSTSLYYIGGRYSSDLITWNVLPVAPGASAYTLNGNYQSTTGSQVTDGTRIITVGGTSWNPFPYTTGTQFIVPNFGANALGSASSSSFSPAIGGGSLGAYFSPATGGGTWGAYNYIKT